MRLYRQEMASSYALTAIMAGVVGVLGTRLFLELSGYPSLGRGMWHLSHTIWGGILMCIGMFMSMSFYGRRSLRVASGIFGFGMGVFFDEMGKFITRDNNYFFKPTSMIVYIVFLVLFGVYRLLTKKRRESGVHLFYHVLDRLGDLAENDLDEKEQTKLIEVVKVLKERSHHELAVFSAELEKALWLLKPKKYEKSWTNLIVNKIDGGLYKYFLSKKGVLLIMGVLMFGYSVASIVDTVWLVQNINKATIIPNFLGEYSPKDGFEIYMLVIKILSDLAVAGLFLIGLVMAIFRRYRHGLEFFEWGLYIYILLTSMCRFYFEQFSAVLALFISLGILAIVRMLRVENKA